MQFIGGIEGMNFKPIADYNGYLKNSAAFSFDTNLDFENVLNSQTAALQQNPKQIQSGIEMNANFDDMLAQNVQSTSNSRHSQDSAGNFMNSISKSISSGLNSVDNTVDAANKAQEAFALGEDISVHDVMIASEKSALSMQMAMQLRNKLLTAYTEINNVRV